jgi:hypothetical protein
MMAFVMMPVHYECSMGSVGLMRLIDEEMELYSLREL